MKHTDTLNPNTSDITPVRPQEITFEELLELGEDQVYELIQPFDDDIATVSVDTGKMRQDLYEYAIQQGVSEPRAELAAKLFFPIIGRDNIVLFNQRRRPGKNEPDQGTFVKKVAELGSMLGFDWEGILETFEKATYFNHRFRLRSARVSPDIISIHSLFSKHTLSSVRVVFPKDMLPPEMKTQYIKQALDAMWRHEREHLVQFLKPEKDKAITDSHIRHRKIDNLMRSIFKGALFISWLSTGLSLLNLQLPTGVSVSIGLAMPVSILINMISGRAVNLLTDVEIEAYAMMTAEHHRDNSPFTVLLEKADPNMDPQKKYFS